MQEQEYINRKDLIDIITKKFQEHYGTTNYQFINDFFTFVLRQIEKQPTISLPEIKKVNELIAKQELLSNCGSKNTKF
jgi:hypothetical protein